MSFKPTSRLVLLSLSMMALLGPLDSLVITGTTVQPNFVREEGPFVIDTRESTGEVYLSILALSLNE